MKRVAVGVAALALLWVGAPAAWAHVTVSSPNAAPGEEAVLSFSVPTESDTASTTKLEVQLPAFEEVAVRPHAGWTYSMKKAGGGIEVDWTASSAATAIKPGQFDVFEVRAGPLPHADSVSFGAIQTYSDGTVVAWNQVAAPGSTAEPEHPKPTLKLTTAVAAAPKPARAASTTAPTILAIIALVVAAAALGVAVVGNARRKASP